MRPVVFHYHFFKNAGTSVDAILSHNFGKSWLSAEFDGLNNHEAVGRWIANNPQANAFSSHTAQFPMPNVADVEVLPVLFLRHPLDRLLSAYSFERAQVSDSLGARLAKTHDLAGYIRTRLDLEHDRQCRNFQTFRLARFVPGPVTSELDRALETVLALPFIGLVEDFDDSVHRMEVWLKAYFPDFAMTRERRNVSASKDSTMADRLDRMREEIGESLWSELLDANLKDLCIHHAAIQRVAKPRVNTPAVPN